MLSVAFEGGGRPPKVPVESGRLGLTKLGAFHPHWTQCTHFGYNVPMGREEVLAYRCDVCGYKWLPRGNEIPVRCPARDCRARGWDGVPKGGERKVPVAGDGFKGGVGGSGIDALRQAVRYIEQRGSVSVESVEAESQPGCEACGTAVIWNKVMKWDECPECGWHGKKQI